IDWLYQIRDADIEVTTKWGYPYVANFDPNATVHEVKEHSLDKLNEQWGFSKKLLPYLKTYQIHSATLETAVLENTDVLNRLHGLKEKYGLQIGLTTTGSNQLEVLQKALDVDVQGMPLFSSAQVTFNILDQSLMDMKPVLEHRNMQLLVKEALANGRLIPNDHYGQYQKLYAYLAKLGTQYQVGTDAIALRFVMDIFPSAIVLSGANNEEHLTANLKAETFELSERELETLRQFSTTPETYWNERKQLSWN
ncbi:MAG: aldo/keto reductase, partial [Flavobacteriaceae bacterium]